MVFDDDVMVLYGYTNYLNFDFNFDDNHLLCTWGTPTNVHMTLSAQDL